MPLVSDLTKFTTASPLTTSFSYTEIATGVSILDYQCFGQTDSVGISYGLGTKAWWAVPQSTSADVSNSLAFTEEAALDFDSGVMTKGITVEGTATVNGSFILIGGEGDGSEGYILFTFYHYDGTTETSLGTIQTPTQSVGGDTTTVYTFLCSGTLSKKKFKAGDLIRVTAGLWGKKTGTDDVPIALAHDPQNRDANGITATTNPTTLNITIPTRI